MAKAKGTVQRKVVSKASAKATAKKGDTSLFGLSRTAWISGARIDKHGDFSKIKNIGHIFFFGEKDPDGDIQKLIGAHLQPWQLELIAKRKDTLHVQSAIGPLWIVKGFLAKRESDHHGLLDDSPYGRARDLVGGCMPRAKEYELEHLRVVLFKANDEQRLGALVGLEMGGYSYKKTRYGKGPDLPQLHIEKVERDVVAAAAAIGSAVNIARHLVNIPGRDLHPQSYGQFIKSLFEGSSCCGVTIWKDDKLASERLDLLRSVGRGAEFPSELVRISHRPSGRKKGAQPIAFVGKGVTFDTGGLDIKQSQFMRLMKKDMGGSATLVGLAWWLNKTGCEVPCDIYLALAENSVDANSIRPGDVLEARNGKTVEIHNTDAEGRLVMADAMLVALAQSGAEKPAALIDAATLTGAMRVALGTKVAGLCANHDGLSDALLAAGQKASDPCWRMPLIRDYRELLRSSCADMTNCSASPYAGAVTAALFLEEFVADTKWAHLDMMAWAEKPAGAIGEVGGNGQMLQAFVTFLQDFDMDQLA